MKWTIKKRERVEKILISYGNADPTVTLQLLENELATYHPPRWSQMTPASDPFESIFKIIDVTVVDDHKKRMLIHNLNLFRAKLKEAQNRH